MREYSKTMDQRMFDFAGFYTKVVQELPISSVLIEVGSGEGSSIIFLAEALLNLGKKFKLYAVDSLAYGGMDQLTELMRHMGEADLSSQIEILPTDSLNTSCRFPDGHFDFVFIDASHRFELTKADIRLWYRKVKEEGILAGHDYNVNEGSEVKAAVDLVIPRWVIRQDIPDRFFDPEPVLQVEKTDKELGIWWLKKKWYVRIF